MTFSLYINHGHILLWASFYVTIKNNSQRSEGCLACRVLLVTKFLMLFTIVLDLVIRSVDHEPPLAWHIQHRSPNLFLESEGQSKS